MSTKKKIIAAILALLALVLGAAIIGGITGANG
jgi:hypothetical protein